MLASNDELDCSINGLAHQIHRRSCFLCECFYKYRAKN